MHVLDSDDLDPRFAAETYTAKVTSGASSGALRVLPEKIRAEDGDTLRSRIRYSLAAGSPPSFRQHFAIDPDTGVVRQTRPVQKGEGADLFDIVVMAEEATPSRRSAKARLLIQVSKIQHSYMTFGIDYLSEVYSCVTSSNTPGSGGG